MKPFEVNIPQATLDDLRERLARTRWTDEVSGTDWSYGTDLAYLKELIHYWQNNFDWRVQEAALNKFSHFRAQVNDLNIHFIHERGKGHNPLPLVLLHGWPSSFWQMLKIMPLLTDANHSGDTADSFDVLSHRFQATDFQSDRRKRE